ncbi:ABC transporter ATP-binding protein [Candidatus Woesebacteria bacterium]|nr:ABC transporter ATP-binding protein [Candidatus Woesebacteria bacterium]MCD8506769.1 ABC transporter ATP-binding protein [Candidatus Woesebacteria bacterium]MCD8527678.1 ABC transporter ATP-binding protein [Candidatus Woesebacteria bacterium]MCD8546353.1 ABC transporter ATP-binding protein [Candidatus Woesebacteria bacterium]
MSTPTSAITAEGISKSFEVGDQRVPVLKNISFTVKQGEFLVIFGPSGCGKSTLLHVLLGLEFPTKGSVQIHNKNIYGMNEDELADFRKHEIGMVYQQPHWVKALNVLENVAFPLTLMRVEKEQRLQQALELLRMVDMEDWAHYLPSELSSGQQQRVALARAIISNPDLIVADEPTGNLDYEAGLQLMSLLENINKKTGKTVIMVTHDLEYMPYATRALEMLDGEVIKEVTNTNAYAQNGNIPLKRGNGKH